MTIRAATVSVDLPCFVVQPTRRIRRHRASSADAGVALSEQRDTAFRPFGSRDRFPTKGSPPMGWRTMPAGRSASWRLARTGWDHREAVSTGVGAAF